MAERSTVEPVSVVEPASVALVLGTSTGGVGQHVRSLAAGLGRHGRTVRVCGPAATEALFGFTAAGASFCAVGIAVGARPVRSALAVAALRRAVAGFDVVHAHGLRAGLLAGMALTGRSTPYVVTWHNAVLATGAAGRMAAAAEQLVARRADVSLAASADLAARVARLGGRDVRPVEVAAPVLSPPQRTPGQVRAELRAGGRPLVLCVARLHPQKGLDTLLAAAAAWRGRQPVPLTVVAGSGPLEPVLRARIDAAKLPVSLLGRRTDIADLLAAADVVVLPSRWEARALAAQEALRAGRPLVATAVGGLPELLGDAAVLVPPDDPDALAAAVAELLDRPAAAAALAARGARRAAAWPDEAATVRRVAAVYAELTGPAG